AVDAVIDEDDGDGLAAIGGMEDFRGSDGGEVAITLVGNDDTVGAAALDGGGGGGRAALGGPEVSDVEVVVAEDGASDGADEHGAVLNAEFVDGAGEELVDDAVAAARTIMRLVLQLRLAVERVVEGGGALMGGCIASHG